MYIYLVLGEGKEKETRKQEQNRIEDQAKFRGSV